ncbi:MAG: substrate-binding domain-containing protein, partial [Verrucomicrobiota bacterium]
IGATVAISQYVLPSVLRELRESFPAFEISVVTEDSRPLMRLLELGEIDLALALETPMSDRFKVQKIFEDDLQMAFSPLHPFAKKKKIGLEDLVEERIIFYSEHSESFRIINEQTARSGIRLKATMQVGSMAAIKEMAKIGMGIGLITPWTAYDEINTGALQFRRLPFSEVRRRWSIHWDPRHDTQIIEEVFSGICQNVVESQLLRSKAVLKRTA